MSQIKRDVAIKSCHNCRRRRLRCDRSYPGCGKCVSRGIECLGYGQLFQWTGSVASRGKLAGESSAASLCGIRPTSEGIANDTEPPADEPEACSRVEIETGPFHVSHDGVDDYSVVSSTQIVSENNSSVVSRFTNPRTLIDPLFQDMSYSHRRYLDYFSSRVCLDLIANDAPGRNPFRNLVPLAHAHPLLKKVIVAASASHMYGQMRPSLSPELLFESGSPGPILMDALIAKQGALRMMPAALRSIDAASGDVILAACLFLVNVELMESGRQGWRPHLEGAGRVMSLIRPITEAGETLRDYIMSDCLVYHVLSSVFSPSSPGYFPVDEAMSVLRKATNHFFCCPPEVLEIILSASRLSHATGDGDGDGGDGPSEAVAAGSQLFQRAHSVDVLGWSLRAHHASSPIGGKMTGSGSRFRTGSAHRLAACLYILQAVPPLHDVIGEELVDVITDDLRHYLDSIPPADSNFKATSWPTFVLGAAAEAPDMRERVMTRLEQLAIVYPWGFIYTAMEGLRQIWRLRDAGGEARKGWLLTLRQSEHDLLIV